MPMITKQVELKASPEEVAELLFELNDSEVAKVFSLWKKKFDDEYERKKAAGETIWIFDLNHFMLYVIDKMDEDAKLVVSSMYGSLVYRLVDDVSKKHLLNLHLH